jgi:hypothetical protein
MAPKKKTHPLGDGNSYSDSHIHIILGSNQQDQMRYRLGATPMAITCESGANVTDVAGAYGVQDTGNYLVEHGPHPRAAARCKLH